ncbi:hypothetical protein H4I96_07615 [Botrytis cinerea]
MGTITLKKHQKSEHLPLLASLRKHEVQWQTSTFPRIFSPLQSEPQLEFDRRTTNHGLHGTPNWGSSMPFQPGFGAFFIMSLPLVQKN